MESIIRKGQFSVIEDSIFEGDDFDRYHNIIVFSYPIDETALEAIGELACEHIINCEAEFTRRNGKLVIELQLTRHSQIRSATDEVRFFLEADWLNDAINEFLEDRKNVSS